MKRFLIIQTAFLGDVILATPVIGELKRLFPDSSIDVLVRKGNESLLLNNPHISRVFVFDKKGGKLRALKTTIAQLRKNTYDELINLQRFGSSGIISLFAKAKQKTGFKKNPFSFCYTRKMDHQIGNGQHEIERNLTCIKHLGAHPFVRPTLFPSDSDLEKVAIYKAEPFVVFAPASVWFTKQLPKEKWIELGKRLSKSSHVILIGGPSDFLLCEEIKTQINSNKVLNLAGTLTLLESAALMKDAVRNYVNDSGPLHIASAMNAPVTAFFCSTTPLFGFGPVSEDAVILEHAEKLTCKPCGLHGFKSCPQGHFTCGEIHVHEA